MPRVKRGTVRTKKRKALLSKTKGYRWGRNSLVRAAKTAVKKAGQHAFRDRRNKKRTMRALWNVRLNAAVREEGMTYSTFIHALKKANIALDRKVLAHLAADKPAVFKKIVAQVKSS